MANAKKEPRVPIYKQIKDELSREIAQANRPPNSPFLSENEAIERFKVSRVTVRQAFELLEQEGYIYRVQGKGSFIGPHDIIPTKIVAFLGTCILSSGIESVLLRSIEDYLDKNNYNLITCNTNNNFAKTTSYIKRLIRNKVDAIIYICVLSDQEYNKNTELIDYLRNNGIPVVLVDRYVEDLKDSVFIVTPDNVRGAQAMTTHLASIGHARIGMLVGMNCSSVDERIAGYRQSLDENGLEFRPEFIKRVTSYDDYKVAAMQFLMMKDAPTAIFCANDDMACRLIEAFADFNINVPENIAVVGFGDHHNFQTSRPVHLTTVRVPLWEEGKLAASIVVDILQGRDITPTHIQVPCELVIRETCGIKQVGKKLAQLRQAHHDLSPVEPSQNPEFAKDVAPTES